MEFLKLWEIISRRKVVILAIFLQFFILSAIGTILIKPSYEAKSLVLVSQSDVVSTLRKALGLMDTSGTSTSDDEEYDTEIVLATVKPVLKKLVAELKLTNKKGEAMKPEELTSGSLKKKFMPEPHVEIDQYEEADILEIVANSSSAKEAASIANTFADFFIESTLERTREESKSARVFIESQIKIVKDGYYKALTDVKDFMIKEKTVNLSYESQLLLDKIEALKTSYDSNERDIAIIQDKQAEITDQLGKVTRLRKSTEVFVENERLAELKSRLNELLISISVKSIDFHKAHPTYKQIEKEIDSVNDLIRKELSTIFSSEQFGINPVYDELLRKQSENYIDQVTALAKQDLFQTYIAEYQKELMKVPLVQIENDKLEIELNSLRQTYSDLLEYRLRVNFAESLTLSNIRIVDPADVPEKQNFPKTAANLILGIVFGIFFGLCGAFFLEYIDYSVKTPDDLQQFKQMTYIGSLPKAKPFKRQNTIAALDPVDDLLETVRTVANNITYAMKHRPVKSISITSSIESEGKSSFASNISILFARKGLKVVLVELDLRRPSLEKYFKITSDQGISDVLSGSVELEQATVATEIEGLDLLPAGSIPRDPNNLLESPKLSEVMQFLHHNYDMVFVDLPPVLKTNDTMVVNRITDGAILVIESLRATFQMVERTIQALEKADVHLIGAVLNKSRAGWTVYSGYTYGQYFIKIFLRMHDALRRYYTNRENKHSKLTGYILRRFIRINEFIIEHILKK